MLISQKLGIEGWTIVVRRRRVIADLIATIFRSRGLHVEILGGRVMVPDEQAETAYRIVLKAEPKPRDR